MQQKKPCLSIRKTNGGESRATQ